MTKTPMGTSSPIDPSQGSEMGVYLNLTAHTIRLNDGTEFPPSGEVAHVQTSATEGSAPHIRREKSLINLPPPVKGQTIIASKAVRDAAHRAGRRDVVSPATWHPQTVRDDRGRVVSVPFLAAIE